MAAGLTMQRENVPAFRDALNAVARDRLGPDDLVPRQRIDLVVQLDQLDLRLEKMLRALEPCGSGNPAPVFGAERVWARNPRVVGGKHLRLTLDDGAGRIPGIGFDWGDRLDEAWARAPVDVAFRLERDEWKGMASLQARVVDIHTAA
jgi:single-stranded-DNA-specific exonuclease